MKMCQFRRYKDGGYAWIVLGCCMVINFFDIGLLFGVIGVLTDLYTKEFNINEYESSWVGSVLQLLLFSGGPLAGYLISKVGVRGAAVSSVLLHITGLAVSSAAKQTWHVICSFSILSGLACCCSHLCTLNMLTLHFEKRQYMAFAASAIGSDLAAVLFPIITSRVVERWSYTYSILILSSFIVVAVPCAILFVAPSQTRDKDKQEGNNCEDDNQQVGSSLIEAKQCQKPAVEHPGLVESDNPIKPCSLSAADDSSPDDTAPPGYRHEAPEPERENHSLRDHVALLTTPSLIVFFINCFLWSMGGSVIAVLTYSFYIKDCGTSYDAASLGMTMLGIGSLSGSVSLTAISSVLSLNRLFIHWACNLGMGVITIALPLVSVSTEAMTACLTAIGFGYGMICANMGSVIDHLHGSYLLYLVYGYQMAAAGVGSFIGPVVGAKLNMQFGGGSAFFYGGSAHLLALFLFLIYVIFNRSILKPFKLSSSLTPDPNDEGHFEIES